MREKALLRSNGRAELTENVGDNYVELVIETR